MNNDQYRIAGLHDLATFARHKKAVICPSVWGPKRPFPAVVILNMPARKVLCLINRGLFVYKKQSKNRRNR